MSQEPAAEMAFHRDNHYVPCSYLKRWTDADRVWAYRVLVPHSKVSVWKRASVKGIAYHAHLYTRVATAGETDEVERWLDAEFEAPAKAAIQRVVDDARLSPDDWRCLIRFVAAQDVRTPARLLEMMHRWKETLPRLLQQSLNESVQGLESAKQQGRPLETRGGLDAKDFPSRVTTECTPNAETGVLRVETVVGRAMWLYFLRHLLTETLEVLHGHRWTILRPPENRKWVTTDDPVIRLKYYGPGKYDFYGGWGRAGCEILLPLGPNHLLYTKIGDRPHGRCKRVSESMFEIIQRFTIEHAHRFVFADAQDPKVPIVRPRLVDSGLYKSEIGQWRRWHEEQSGAERELLGS
jgi:Protein of unknown function (DUF4238)